MAPGTVMAQDARPKDAIAAAARTDPAETQGTSRASSRAAAAFREGAKAAERRRIAKHFLQAFPNLGHFSPSFSKQSFGGFVGFQWVARVSNRKSPFSKLFSGVGFLSTALLAQSRHVRQPREAWARAQFALLGAGGECMGAGGILTERSLTLASISVI
jgi:hypothetical protein